MKVRLRFLLKANVIFIIHMNTTNEEAAFCLGDASRLLAGRCFVPNDSPCKHIFLFQQ